MQNFVTRSGFLGMTHQGFDASWCVMDVTEMLRKMTHQMACVMPCVMPYGAYLKENDAMTHDEPLKVVLGEKLVASSSKRKSVGLDADWCVIASCFGPTFLVTREEI